MNGSKFDFSQFFWGGAPPQTPPPAFPWFRLRPHFSGASRSRLGLGSWFSIGDLGLPLPPPKKKIPGSASDQSYGLQIFLDSSDIYSTKCFLFSLKCTKFVSVWGSAPDPAGGAYSAPPNPLAGFGWDREGRQQKIFGRTPFQNPGYGPDHTFGGIFNPGF